ncbi:MAG: exodeoxyribonuclease VII large subunit [Phycisphaeraceae bacterium]
MTRLPFNPDAARGGEGRKGGGGRGASGGGGGKDGGGGGEMTVSQVAGMIRTALAEHTPQRVRVVGEVSNFTNRQHWYFSLKDEQATLRCVCFASANRRVRTPMQDGLEVVATGRLDYYDRQGHVQLYVDAIEPVGQGALELKLRQMIDELRGQGYFDEAHKRGLPAFPQIVAVVTSRSGAALQDVINTAHRRLPGCRLLLYDVKVQGASAAPQVAAAIRTLSEQGPGLGIDAIIVTRGGGSIEDLWAFNEREVADAIYDCALPIVAAIGHETDVTVAELVADRRCATPTQAAMQLIPERAALAEQVRYLTGRLGQELARLVRHERHRVEACAARPLFRRPGALVEQARRRLGEVELRMVRALPRRVEPARARLVELARRLSAAGPRRVGEAEQALARHEARLGAVGARLTREHRRRLDAVVRHLEAVSPRRVLARGYSYTLGPGGEVVRRAGDVEPGQVLTTVLADGQVRSRVEGDGAARPTRTPPRRRGKRPDADADEGGLFG